jgi:ABC-2 type transport system permease protein
MSTTSSTAASANPNGSTATSAIAALLDAPPSVEQGPQSRFAPHWRTIKIVWFRELLRVRSDRVRLISSLAQPFLFLFVMGTGLSEVTQGSTGVDYQTFIFPGVLTMSVLFTAMFSSVSIVWDREFGFLREMLVAPVPRSAIIIGKALGGATVATGQGVVVLSLAGVADVPYDPAMLALLMVELLVLAFAVGSFGLMVAARIRQMQAFFGIMNLVVMPLYFLAGGLYPIGNLPDWLQVITKINPLTYAVAAMRHTVFSYLDLPAGVQDSLDSGVTWFGWSVPSVLCVVVVGALGLIMLRIAVAELEHDG